MRAPGANGEPYIDCPSCLGEGGNEYECLRSCGGHCIVCLGRDGRCVTCDGKGEIIDTIVGDEAA